MSALSSSSILRASAAPRAGPSTPSRRPLAASALAGKHHASTSAPPALDRDEAAPLARARAAAVALAAAAAIVAAPDAALANAFDGDLSPTNGPLKSLPKGTHASPPPPPPQKTRHRRHLPRRSLHPPRARRRRPSDSPHTASSAPLRSALPRSSELTEPDEIFREDFTVKFAGLEVDHKYLVGALIAGQAIGFVGSLVGGNEARKKGDQVRELNASLLKVNAELRREMRAAGIGPYQPIPANRFIEKPPGMSTDEDEETAGEVIVALRGAKRELKDGECEAALGHFEDALRKIRANPQALNEAWKAERKAHRGIGAAAERLGRFDDALEAMETVLRLSTQHDDHAGETDALGVIADIYTDMDRLEEAAEYYDRYFVSLQEEDAKKEETDAKAVMTSA
jgi:hypothetical protein